MGMPFAMQKLHRIIFPASESGVRISIISPSDFDSNQFRRLQWGDYWVKYELIKSLGQMGCIVTDQRPNVVIHLFGSPARARLPKWAFKIIWIYSHPERVNPKLLKRYDKIYCLSSLFAQKVREMGFECEVLYGATSKKRFYTDDYRYDIFFVGNNRLKGVRKIVQDVGNTAYNFKVWGKGWDGKIPPRYIGGRYIDYTNLNEYYASSRISLNDHNEEMRREGFVAVKIFDILASGGFCISDKNSGIEEIFEDNVPQYESPTHLRELIDFYINHPEERLRLIDKGGKIALSHTWQKRAEQFLKGINELRSRVKR